MGQIQYKTKVQYIWNSEGTEKEPYINYKRVLGRSDCTLKNHEHTYYNSDLFPSMLNRAHKNATQGKEWCRLRELPDGVQVDTSKFLAVVTVSLPDNFR